MDQNRRDFLRTVGMGAGVAGAMTLLPATGGVLAQGRRGRRGRILVVVQQTGGNDGLNMVVPAGDDAYHRARPRLRLAASRVLPLAAGVGLHPRMTDLKRLYDAGRVAVVQGVGYPEPNRSHFRSMEIWHTANPGARLERDGWLGRYLARRPGDLAPGIEIGNDLPLALVLPSGQVTVLPNPRSFRPLPDPRARGDRTERLAALRKLQALPRPSGAALGFVAQAGAVALRASERVQGMVLRYSSPAPYRGRLGRDLRLVASLVAGGGDYEVYYLSQGGYDTHAQQPGRHARLLQQLSANLSAFLADLRRLGRDREVLVMTFSEFGRRVAENASRGTDHGTAGTMLLLSGRVRGGLHGRAPSLTDLDRGDLKFTTDFRRVYATVLEKWLGASSHAILRGRFAPLPLVS